MKFPTITEELVIRPFRGLKDHKLYRFKYFDQDGLELEYTVLLPPDQDPRKISVRRLREMSAVEAYDEAVRCLKHEDGCNIKKLGTPEHKDGRGCDCACGRLGAAIETLRKP